MTKIPDEFTALLAQARDGDECALAQLAQKYEPKVRIVAHVLLGASLRPHLDSLDLVQSVHRSLIMGLRLKKFDISTPEELVALTVTLVRRKVARHWRHLRRQQRLSLGPDDRNNLPELLVSLSSPQADPAREAELHDAVRHLCDNLSVLEQNILELCAQDYDMAEIAGQLGLNPIALRVRLSRLRKRLRESGMLADWI